MPVESEARTEMVLNASDTLKRWTNGVVPAAMRGDTATRVEADKAMVPERRSAVLLYQPKGKTSVGPMAQFCDTGASGEV